MPKIAFFECAQCGQRVSPEHSQTVCPLDAGLLYVRYDMEALRGVVPREHPAQLAAASTASLGMRRYADVLPDIAPVTLGEGWTPLIRSRRYPNLLIKNEGANPTGSTAARGISMAVTMVKARGCKHVAMASEDEDVGALAAYAAAAQIAAHIFVPQDASSTVDLEALAYGADLARVDGTISACAKLLGQSIAEQHETDTSAENIWCDVSAWKEPFRLEGAKTLGYELVEQLGWTYPDAVLYPASDGISLLALWKAFTELEQLGWAGKRPRIYALQAAGLAAETTDSEKRKRLVLEAVRESGGRMLVSDEAAIPSLTLDWAKAEGMLLCPEGAMAAGAYSALLAEDEIKQDERVVIFNTSAAWKHSGGLAKAMRKREPRHLPRSLPVGGIITPV